MGQGNLISQECSQFFEGWLQNQSNQTIIKKGDTVKQF
jgi:hypothetical protein